MNRTTKAGLFGLGLIVSLPSAAVAPTVEKFKVDGDQLVAEFETTDASGCIVTSVSVVASESVTRINLDNFTSSSFRLAFYVISQFDTCKSAPLVFTDCLSDAFTMTIDSNLHNGHLIDTAVFCFDEVRKIGVYIDVDVSFQATQSPRRDKIKTSLRLPGYRQMFQQVGLVAEGVARGGVVEHLTNYTSGASTLAIVSKTAFSDSRFIKN